MNELEKPGKCPVCHSNRTHPYEATECDSDGDFGEDYAAVRCLDCHCELRQKDSTKADVIAIWNRLSDFAHQALSPVAPVPPADEVEVVGGAGSGEERKLSHGWGWHIDATDMYDKTCPECGDNDGLKIEAGIGPYSLCVAKCLACGHESAACSVYPDSDRAEKEALEGWGDQGSDEEVQS